MSGKTAKRLRKQAHTLSTDVKSLKAALQVLPPSAATAEIKATASTIERRRAAHDLIARARGTANAQRVLDHALSRENVTRHREAVALLDAELAKPQPPPTAGVGAVAAQDGVSLVSVRTEGPTQEGECTGN